MAEQSNNKIALVGATGAIGKSVAAALRAQGRGYRVIGRSRSALETTFGDDPLAEFTTWEPDHEESIRAALQGVTAVVYLIGVPYTDFHLHPILMRRVLDAAVAEHVDRLLLIGTLYVFGRPQRKRIMEDHPREPHTFKGRMRKEQEDLVLAAHTSGKIKTTILRLPDFYGPGVERSMNLRTCSSFSRRSCSSWRHCKNSASRFRSSSISRCLSVFFTICFSSFFLDRDNTRPRS